MMSGVEQTTLYPIKETKEFYQSIEVWASCASKFRMKKKNVQLNVDLPIITDEKTVEFLEEHSWDDWVKKNKEGADTVEAIALLDKLFPTHEKVFFYELNYLIGDYLHGTFVSYDDEGNVKPRSEHNIKSIKYRLQKYGMRNACQSEEVKEYMRRWTECKGTEEEKGKLLREYVDFEREWVYKNANITDVFIEVGKNSVCYPVAFSEGTGMWAIEKYGKPMAYSNAGEIFFVATKDKVFFEITRHF